MYYFSLWILVISKPSGMATVNVNSVITLGSEDTAASAPMNRPGQEIIPRCLFFPFFSTKHHHQHSHRALKGKDSSGSLYISVRAHRNSSLS